MLTIATTTEVGSSGTQIILPAPAELLLPAIAFALIAAVAGVVLWLIVRAVSRTSDDLAVQVARLEAENHELRLEVDALKREHV